MIKKYQEFITEVYTITKDDPPETKSDQTFFKKDANTIQDNIKEYLAKKSEVENIIKNSKSSQDLNNKLFPKYIKQKTTNPVSGPINSINPNIPINNFINKLIGMWAQYVQKEIKVSNIEKTLKGKQDSLKDDESKASQNPDLMGILKQGIDDRKSEISNLQIQIKKHSDDLKDIDKNITLRLAQLKKDLVSSNNYIKGTEGEK